MSNPYYTYGTGTPAAQSRGTSSPLRGEYTLIAAGFDAAYLVNALKTGDTYTGNHNFTGATYVRVPAPSNVADAVTKAYADALAFSATLPNQSGNNGKFLTTDGATASWAVTTIGANATITTPTIVGTKETKVAMAANNIDCAAGNCFTKTISGVTTLTVSSVPASGTFFCFILDITNGGSAAVTWWSGVKWPLGVPPTLTTSGRDSLGFYTVDGGTSWIGLVLGKAFA